MAITPGNNFKLSDLQDLAAQANSVSSVYYDLTNFYNVSPMGIDASDNNWGYRVLSAVTIDPDNPGTGYQVGDLVSAGYEDSFEVEAVNASGAVIVLRTINPGWGQYSDPSTLSVAMTGGNGSGLQISANFSQYGPRASYSFPEFTPNYGYVGSFFVVNGGSGFNVSDTLHLADFPGWVITVTAVAGGAITAVSFPGASVIIPNDYQNMIANALMGIGTGARLGAYVTLGQQPGWLTELNRLRNAIYQLPLKPAATSAQTFLTAISPAALCVSGPWPIGGPTSNFSDTWFYFPGTTATVSFASNRAAFSTNTFSTTTCWMIGGSIGPGGVPVWTGVQCVEYTTMEMDFVVGGTSNINVNGTFAAYFGFNRGGTFDSSGNFTPDTVDPASIISVSGNMPGTYTTQISTGAQLELYWTYNGTLAPGRYKAILTFNNPPSDPTTGPLSTIRTRIFVGAAGAGIQTGEFTGTVSYLVSGPVVAVPGIDNSQPVSAIQVPGDLFGNGPGLLGSVNTIINYNDVINPPFAQPIFAPEQLSDISNYTVTTSVPGFWTAKTNAVNNLNMAGAANMPWNLQRTKFSSGATPMVNPMLQGDLGPTIGGNAQVSNSYNQSATVEQQLEPPPWLPNRYFTAGFIIQDSNGNFQKVVTAGISGSPAPTWATRMNNSTTDNQVTWTLVYQLAPSTNPWVASSLKGVGDTVLDLNGRTQLCIHAGTTGTAAPAWSKTFGAKTKDGTVTWQMMNPYVATVHRVPDLPRYPYYWQSETLPRLMPPTSTSGLTIWGAYDQWQPVNKSGVDGVGHTLFDSGWHSTHPAGGAYGATADTQGMAYGWWVYSVSLNRMNYVIKTPPSSGPGGTTLGTGDTGATGASAGDSGASDAGAGGTAGTPGPGGGEVSVTIGCMRSGSFVAFGTYLTGQTVRVLWPIFTSDALVYQCSERVDIQALAIAAGGFSVSTGATITTPALVAAFVNDTAQLLNLIT